MTQQNQPKQTDSALEQTLQELFGNQAHCSPLSTPMRMGRRVHGIDLKETLSGAQAGLLQTLLDQFNILLMDFSYILLLYMLKSKDSRLLYLGDCSI